MFWTGQVKLSGVQDHATAAQIVGGELPSPIPTAQPDRDYDFHGNPPNTAQPGPEPSNIKTMSLNRECQKCGWVHVLGTECPKSDAMYGGAAQPGEGGRGVSPKALAPRRD